MNSIEPLYRQVFQAQEIVAQYPARLNHENKVVVYQMASPVGALHEGEITVSRWGPMELPDASSACLPVTQIQHELGFFPYSVPPSGQCDWYLNFAHSDLFCAYGGALFAQDEIQVAEHPALGSLRHALRDMGNSVQTVGSDGAPTPILIQGVQRRCSVATEVNPEQGRPRGLYGNAFSWASQEAIRQAVMVLDPPTRSNIVAMEAPSGRYGDYQLADIEFILQTAYTGFRAAYLETARQGGANRTAIHTGYWGCGAYGGNRELMVLLQILAANFAEVPLLFFHCGDDGRPVENALGRFGEIVSGGESARIANILQWVHGKRYRWGVSDGN
jgi:hypothetical protein